MSPRYQTKNYDLTVLLKGNHSAFGDLFLTPTYRALYNAWTEDTFSSSYSQPS